MEPYNWAQFTTRIPVKASRQSLYDAWATRKGIEHWFLRTSEYRSPDGVLRKNDEHVQAGDQYMWQWEGWPDEVKEEGTIIACNGKDHFKFSFGDAGVCDVRIVEESNQTIVELIQTQIPIDEHGKHYWHLGCKTGWTFHLTNLKSIFEGGHDLRNKDKSIKNVVNA